MEMQPSAQNMQSLARIYNQGLLDLGKFIKLHLNPNTSTTYPTSKSALIFPIAGRGMFQFDQHRFVVGRGHMLHGCPRKLLTITPLGGTPFSYIIFYYDSSMELLFSQSLKFSEELLSMLTRILPLTHSVSLKDQFLLKQYHDEFFSLLFRDVQEDYRYGEQAILNDLLAFIHAHYNAPVTLSSLAALVNEKPARISYLFHKYLNIRPIDYLIDYRMKLAIEQIKTTDCTITEAARQVGYNDVCYFSRIFKRRLGFSPSRLKD